MCATECTIKLLILNVKRFAINDYTNTLIQAKVLTNALFQGIIGLQFNNTVVEPNLSGLREARISYK